MQIAPPPDCHIGTKMSVLWPSKYAKIRFRLGLCPGPRWGSSRRSPRPLSRLERGHPSPYPAPLGTDPPSALAMRPPEVQPDLRLCINRTHRDKHFCSCDHLDPMTLTDEYDLDIPQTYLSIKNERYKSMHKKLTAWTGQADRPFLLLWPWS